MGSYFHLDLFTNKFRLQLAWIRSYASNNVAFDPRRFASKDSSCVSIHICTKYGMHIYIRDVRAALRIIMSALFPENPIYVQYMISVYRRLKNQLI